MADKKEKKSTGPAETQQPGSTKNATRAHEQADKDIGKDPDLKTKPRPEDDLDEGELARLEGED